MGAASVVKVPLHLTPKNCDVHVRKENNRPKKLLHSTKHGIQMTRVHVITCSAVLAVCLMPGIAPCQIEKLSIRSIDSALAPYKGYGFLSGTVTVGEMGIPLSGVAITLERSSSIVTTDVNGRFSLGPLSPNRYVLRASLPGYYPHERDIQISPGSQSRAYIQLTPDYLLPGHTTGGAVITLYERDTGEPVYFNAQFENSREVLHSNLDGTVTAYLLAPGLQRLRITSWEFRSHPFVDSIEIRPGRLAYLTRAGFTEPGVDSQLTCTLPHRLTRPVVRTDTARLGAISGIVQDSSCHLGISAYLFLAPFADRFFTDSSGTFVIRNLAPGRYCLTALQIGYRKKTIHGILVEEGKITVINVFLDPGKIMILN
jgi:hypothetical protein